jgi:hypothetical protein
LPEPLVISPGLDCQGLFYVNEVNKTGKLERIHRHTISAIQKHNTLASYKTMTLPIMIFGCVALLKYIINIR